MTALMVAAASYGDPDVIEVLLKAGADAKAKNREGKRALDLAAGDGALTGTAAYRQLKRATNR